MHVSRFPSSSTAVTRLVVGGRSQAEMDCLHESDMLCQLRAVCSGCIRNNLEFQERKGPAKCPACREKCDARDLRPNHALKDLVQGYLQTRKLLVNAASGLEASTPDAAQVSLTFGFL